MNILSNTLINTKHIRGLNIPQQQPQQQQQQNVDTNINNYSVNDILTIFNLVDEPTLFQIKDVANNLIARMKSEGKMEMAIFFEKAKQKVIAEIEREEDDDDTDSETDDTDIDTDIDVKKHNNSASSSLIGDNWWEQESPIKSQHSREAPNSNSSNSINNINSNSKSSTNNKSMIEYEKNIILEKLRMTEIKLREVEKENKKLRKQIKILLDR
jgi:hypothetical protein